MAFNLSLASASPCPSTQQIGHVIAPRPHHVSTRVCRFKCCGFSRADDKTRCSSSQKKQSESGNTLNTALKVAWYGSELLGIGSFALQRPTPTGEMDEYQDRISYGSGIVDRAVVVEAIKQDFQSVYWVTGNLTLSVYEEDCEFVDPVNSFKGLRRFKRNTTNFGTMVEKANLKLTKWDDFEDKGIGHWQFSCVLSLPWRPIISATGYTEYCFDPKSGKICRHIENRNVTITTLIKQLLKPNRLKESKENN